MFISGFPLPFWFARRAQFLRGLAVNYFWPLGVSSYTLADERVGDEGREGGKRNTEQEIQKGERQGNGKQERRRCQGKVRQEETIWGDL